MIELLAPGGSTVKMKTAFEYGADAVYIGGDVFGLRANADNFSLQEIADAAAYADSLKKKIYVTMNIIARNGDLPDMSGYAKELYQAGVHGVIVSDPGAFMTVKEAAPELPIHISTQANNLNWRTCNFWSEMGAVRVNLARELTLHEIKEISEKLKEKNCKIELEAFVHGAMCMSYSGRCMLSDYFVHRSSNRGDCAQPCRWNYKIIETTRPDAFIDVEENERGTFLFNSKDLCMLPYLKEFKEAGVSSFKIEGRMKSEFYVAVTVRAYRKAIDMLEQNTEAGKEEDLPEDKLEEFMSEVCSVSHRDYCSGFYKGEKGSQIYETSSYKRETDFIGTVDSCESCDDKFLLTMTQRGTFSVGDMLEFVPPDGDIKKYCVYEMFNEKDEKIERAPHATMKVKMTVPFSVKEGTVIRRRKNGGIGSV